MYKQEEDKMAPDNRPRSREKKIVDGEASVKRRGSGLDSKPIGGPSGPSSSSGSGGGMRGSGGFGFGKLIVVVIILIIAFGGTGLFGESEESGSTPATDLGQNTDVFSSSTDTQSGSSELAWGDLLGQLIGGYTTSTADYSSYEQQVSSQPLPQLDLSVNPASRQKFTSIVGQGADMVTIMVYLCGTDLESKSGMGTADLQEMASATISDNVRLLVYTGGCKKWKNNTVSSRVNQIYQVKGGGVKLLEENMGQASMSDPTTLTTFINYCKDNYPANRNELILWDHGSGSLSGYAYDEKFPQSGSMSLSGIKKAISDSGVKFDFVGFDACLMATVETALMLSDYADYMIASEETEPGVGWYYTNWLTKLSEDTSMPTAEIGKNIVDDFVDVCARKCPGQKATLSVTDLAEVAATVPEKLNGFSVDTSKLISDVNGYMTVSDARNKAKEFAQSSRIDQIDFIHFANLLGTVPGKELAETLGSCIKYNRTERTIANANGLSVYFPYKKASKASSMVKTYEQIGMDSAYSDCIRAFASNEQSGQTTFDGEGSPIETLLTSLLLGRGNTTDKKLTPVDNGKGQKVFKLSDDDWKKIAMVDLNVFIDDGEGFLDLGLDNTFTFDDNNDLIAGFDNTWMSINGHIVAYYHTDSSDDGTHYSFNGYVPALLNDQRVELLITFSDEFPDGMITGARYLYDNETDTVAKNTIALAAGDRLEFICKYYDYNGNYKDTYKFGEPLVLDSPDITIGNIKIADGKPVYAYKFTDMYQQESWSDAVRADLR